MQLSPYQQAVMDWTAAHVAAPGALIVEAVAGSGKTTTIVQAASVIPSTEKAVFLAFNKKIAQELAEKLPPHVEARTLNALGWAGYRAHYPSAKVDGNKTFQLIREFAADVPRDVAPELVKIIGKAKAHGLTPGAAQGEWEALEGRYDVNIDIEVIADEVFSEVPPGTPEDVIDARCREVFFEWANDLLARGLDDRTRLDFDDQLYMPVALELPMPRFDWIIIDEAQDVSHVQRVVLAKSLQRGGRLIAVGDSNQAIYGFRGADSDSLQTIQRRFQAERLPLSICYRCPRSIVDIAKTYVPQIESHENAKDGTVLRPTAWNLRDFDEADMIVCRNTAPLIGLAYRCIADGIPVTVLGRDIGKGLTSLAKRVASKADRSLEYFWEKLATWRTKEIAKADDDEAKIQAIEDRVECLRIIGRPLKDGTVDDLIRAIDALFDDQASGPTLCTVHKAKGLEAERVFILEPGLMPSPYAKQDWQKVQEDNLIYVAVTRALDTLVYLPADIIA